MVFISHVIIMIDSEITSYRCNHIWLCNHPLDGYTVILQNGRHPCDVAHIYILAVLVDTCGWVLPKVAMGGPL